MSQLVYRVLANVPVVISSSGKCPSWYIKFWQMSQLLHYDLANVPVNIFCSGKCSPPPPHPVLPHLTKPHPTPTHPTVTLVSKEQPNKLFFSMTYILSSGKFLSLYFDSWKISQMANFPPGQYFYVIVTKHTYWTVEIQKFNELFPAPTQQKFCPNPKPAYDRPPAAAFPGWNTPPCYFPPCTKPLKNQQRDL